VEVGAHDQLAHVAACRQRRQGERCNAGAGEAASAHRTSNMPPNTVCGQLHPLVVPQDSQTKQEPAGRMRTPQVEQ
jgi:hypothetical protein